MKNMDIHHRQELYRFFSILFTYPSDEIIKNMRESALRISSQLSGHKLKGLSELVRLILEETRDLDGVKSLQRDYTSTFINAYPSLPAPPYESYYREGVVMGNSTLSVAEKYMEVGLKSIEEIPDHIAIELEYLYFLTAMRMYEKEREFLKLHLLGWGEIFADKLTKNGVSKFYRNVGTVFKEFLKNLEELNNE